MLTQTKTIDIGPGAISQASTTNGPGFALSAPEWLDIQMYVVNGLSLPTTMDEFKATLGKGAPSDLSDFTLLVAAYAAIHDHVDNWQNVTMPKSVSLASDIHNYAKLVPTYYNPILPLAKKLTNNPNDQDSKDELAGILTQLSKSAKTYHDNAESVATMIQNFANETQNDKSTLSGTDTKVGLQKYYNQKYGSTSAEVKTLTGELTKEKKILDTANKEYNHDVIVAATTPTYAWIWPFGTIAAGIVAGIYGHKATKALENVRAAQQQISSLSDELAADANLMIAINTAESGISNILGPLNAALPIIQKIQGVWGAIADDLNDISNLIKSNIQEALPIIMKLGVEAAIDAWTSVGKEADAYRVNAYITVKKD